MAQLLGTKYCIDSLFHDIRDIQSTVADVNSRTGQVKYQSWKFPDKLSLDLNVNELLDEYKYIEDDEEQNQVSHVMLYDLLIDRLLFLLQSFIHFNEMLLSVQTSANEVAQTTSNSSSKVRSMSAGLTSKKCWSRLTQVATVMQQFAKEIQRKKKMENQEVTSVNTIERSSIKTPPSFTKRASIDASVSEDVLNRSCQTSETAYVSCETCSRTQSCLHEVGKAVVKVCKSQTLPTSLEDYVAKQRDDALMSIAEITRWKNLQVKDLSRIDRHMGNLMKQINPLKKEMSDAALREGNAKDEIKRLNLLADTRDAEFTEEQRKREYKLKEVEKSLRNSVSALTLENNKLKEETEALKIQLSDVKDELLQKHRTLIATENMKAQLKEEALEGKQYQRDALKMQTETSGLYRKLQSIEDKLQECNLQLEKEINQNRTMQSHEQALQEKQRGILKRFDELNEECEELRERLLIAEEEKEEMEESFKTDHTAIQEEKQQLASKNEYLKIMQNEKEVLQRRIEDLQTSVDNLEKQLEECFEREQLLVAYPDLHKPQSTPTLESSGDYVVDMERQVKANQIRIDVLGRENMNLLKALSKVPSLEEFVDDQIVTESHESSYKPQSVQLWKKSPAKLRLNSHNFTSNLHFNTLNINSAPTSIRSSKGSHSKHSVYASNQQDSDSIDAYTSMKQQQQVSPNRTSFSVGPGKRRNGTPNNSRPSSGRSALLKPWT